MVIENKLILDVNKLHFILEKEKNRDWIINEIKNIYKKKYKKELNFNKFRFKNLKSRFDDEKTTLIKRTLQYQYSLQSVCENLTIPYYHFSMLSPWHIPQLSS